MKRNNTGYIFSNDKMICSIDAASMDEIDGKVTLEAAPFDGDQLYHAMTQKRPVTFQIGGERKEFFVSGFTIRPPHTIIHVSGGTSLRLVS